MHLRININNKSYLPLLLVLSNAGKKRNTNILQDTLQNIHLSSYTRCMC